MKHLIRMVSLSLVAATAIWADNARLDALNTMSQRDMNDIKENPALMEEYGDMVQASSNTSGDYNFLLAKKISNSIYLGAEMATGSVLRGSFYTEAQNYVGVSDYSVNSIPNILFAVNMGNVDLGIKLMYEMYRNKSVDESTSGDVTTTQTERDLMSTKGLMVSAVIGEGASVEPYVSVMLPKASSISETTYDGGDNDDTKTEYKDDLGIALNAGFQVRMPMNRAEMVAGAAWQLEKYRFATENDPGEVDKSTVTHSDIYWDYNLGFVGTLGDDLQWAAEYVGSIFIDKTVDEPEGENEVDTRNRDNDVMNTFALSFEKPVEGFWIFDTFTPRAGLAYAYNLDVTDDKDTEDESYHNESITSDYNGVNLTSGFGLSKGRATVDVAADFGDWNNVMTGPSGLAASLTVDFGGSSASSSADSETSASDEDGWEVQ
ncbi:MAG: hypothetical protein ACQEQV_01735 [Fibrobacterota bacterium]